MGKISLDIKEICALFNVGGTYLGYSEVHTGNINCTFRVDFTRDGEDKAYILQRINKNVFKEPEKVMKNIVAVTEHLRGNLKTQGVSTKTGVLRAFLAKEDANPFVVDDVGDYWRCYRFIKNSVTYDTCDDLKIIERVGSAFGSFHSNLKEFDASTLYVTIPNFHNTKVRFKAFHDAVEKDPAGRLKKVKDEVEKLFSYEKTACQLQDYLDDGKIPYRVVHNDTKGNNVSFDKDTGKALAVLDLDTVMPGAVAHDFGDAIRFIANTALEDDPDTSKVSLDLEKYEAFTKGFIKHGKGWLTDVEKETMNLGVFAMTVELAVRFLTDYILGDVYFKVRRPEHNLDRARNQLALAIDIERKKEQMEEIIQKYI